MGRDSKKPSAPPRENPHKVVFKELERVPVEDHEKLVNLTQALDEMCKDEKYHMRQLTRVEGHFQDNGDVLLMVHRRNEPTATYTWTHPKNREVTNFAQAPMTLDTDQDDSGGTDGEP